MKQFFYKSGLMTAVLIMASMVFVLSAVAYFNQKNLYKPLEQMTDDYAVAYGEEESLADLCKEWQKDGETDFKVRGMKLTDGCALQWGSDPEFPLTEGRLFDAGDYEKGTDTALIREDIEALCEKRDGKLYITIGDEEYEVIGKYREKNTTDDRNSRYIVNLYAKNLPVTEGQYLLNGKNIEEYSEKQMARLRNEMFGFVVQDFALIERYTVEKNVMLPLYYSKKYKKNKKQRVEEVLKSLGIWEKREELVRCLSGGQRQRVAIARALVNEAEIILADEPTGALDQATGREVMDLFEEIHNRGKTIILVTHDQKIADRCQRVIEIADGTIKSDR